MDAAFEKLLNKTYRFLSYRPRSVKEVEDYLKKKKATDTDSKKIIEKLKTQKFLNDEEFAKFWVESRTRSRPRASKLIKFELKQKGIENELVESLISNSQILIPSDLDMAIELAKKKVVRFKNLDRQKAYEKLGRFLASKGFDWDTIKRTLSEVLSS